MTEPTEAAPLQHFLVEAKAPGTAGDAALAHLEQRVRTTLGANVQRPRVPSAAARLRISVPPAAATRLQAEFADALKFEPDAELRF